MEQTQRATVVMMRGTGEQRLQKAIMQGLVQEDLANEPYCSAQKSGRRKMPTSQRSTTRCKTNSTHTKPTTGMRCKPISARCSARNAGMM